MKHRTPKTIQLPLPIEGETFKIALTKGYETIVDAIDADLGQVNWFPAIKNDKVYVWRKSTGGTSSDKVTVHIHRLIMERVLNRQLISIELVDHKDNNPLNNTRSNLRLADKTRNAQNAKRAADNTSGFKGVSRSYGKWTAEIRVNKQKIRLGRFDTPEEAYEVYCNAAKHYFGEFARLE